MEDRLLTKDEAAGEVLRVSRTKLDELIARGLPVVKLGHRTLRISEKALAEFLARHTTG